MQGDREPPQTEGEAAGCPRRGGPDIGRLGPTESSRKCISDSFGGRAGFVVRSLSIERVPLGWRLGVLVAAPLLVIAVVAGARLSSLWTVRADGQVFVDRMKDVALIDQAIGHLQDERELTARLLAVPEHLPPPPALIADLQAARMASDHSIAAAD